MNNYQIGDRVQNISTGATGTIDCFLVNDGKITYIVKYDEMQRRPDGFEYQNEEVFAEEISKEANYLAERIMNTLQQTGASAWAERVADKTVLVTRHEGQTETLRVLFIDDDNCISDDYKGVTAERAAEIIIGAREHEGKTLTASLTVIFATREDYERGKQLFDSEGESRLWAGDWADDRQAIEFCDAMPLDELERDVREELDAQGFENYATVDGNEMWV